MIRGADCHTEAASDEPEGWEKVEVLQTLDKVFNTRRTMWLPTWRYGKTAGQLIWLR